MESDVKRERKSAEKLKLEERERREDEFRKFGCKEKFSRRGRDLKGQKKEQSGIRSEERKVRGSDSRGAVVAAQIQRRTTVRCAVTWIRDMAVLSLIFARPCLIYEIT